MTVLFKNFEYLNKSPFCFGIKTKERETDKLKFFT